jgi:hypothetical protein
MQTENKPIETDQANSTNGPDGLDLLLEDLTIIASAAEHPRYELAAQAAERIRDLTAHNARLQLMVDAERELKVRSLNFDADTGLADLRLEPNLMIAILADSMKQWLGEPSEAPNYKEVTVEFSPGHDLGGYTVSITRPKGKTPHQFRLELEEEIERLKHELEQAIATNDQLANKNHVMERTLLELDRILVSKRNAGETYDELDRRVITQVENSLLRARDNGFFGGKPFKDHGAGTYRLLDWYGQDRGPCVNGYIFEDEVAPYKLTFEDGGTMHTLLGSQLADLIRAKCPTSVENYPGTGKLVTIERV